MEGLVNILFPPSPEVAADFFPPRCKRGETPPGVYLPHQGLYVTFLSTDPAHYLRLRLCRFSSSTSQRDCLSPSLQGSRAGENEGIFGEGGADSAHTHFFFFF